MFKKADVVLLDIIRKSVTKSQRKRWSKAAPGWESGGATGLTQVIEELLFCVNSLFESMEEIHAIDLGSGSGQLTLPLARVCKKVYAVDISPAMLERLTDLANNENLGNIEPIVSSIEELNFKPNSVDLIVSNYALHHLLDADKKALLTRAYNWLKPGGWFVLGDMMFGRGLNARDLQIIKGKVRTFAKRGVAGWFRIVKNIPRFIFRFQERPVPIEKWTSYFTQAGFSDLSYKEVIAEAVVMWAKK